MLIHLICKVGHETLLKVFCLSTDLLVYLKQEIYVCVVVGGWGTNLFDLSLANLAQAKRDENADSFTL